MAYTRRRVLLVKPEATYNTSSAPTGTDALYIINPSINPLDATVLERELIDTSFGRLRSQILAQRKVSLDFDVEFAGSGTAGTAPKYGPLLRACGMSEAIVSGSVTYSGATPATDSVTANYNSDGNGHLSTGMRGSFDLKLDAGALPTYSFKMQGNYAAPTDTALPTPTYINQAAPVHVSSANTTAVSVAGYSACMKSFQLSLNNSLVFQDHAGCAPKVIITDRMVSGTIVIERPDALASKNFYTLATAGTTGAISFQHGQTAGGILTVTMSTVNFGAPTPTDIDGVIGLSIPFVALKSAAGLSDELTIVNT
jgi:hypothetical protein